MLWRCSHLIQYSFLFACLFLFQHSLKAHLVAVWCSLAWPCDVSLNICGRVMPCELHNIFFAGALGKSVFVGLLCSLMGANRLSSGQWDVGRSVREDATSSAWYCAYLSHIRDGDGTQHTEVAWIWESMLGEKLPGDAQPTSDFEWEINLYCVEPMTFQHLLVTVAKVSTY